MLFALFWLSASVLFVSAEECPTLRAYVETACDYPELILTSSPNHLVLNKTNCNSEFHKSEWQQQPKATFPAANKDKTYTMLCIDPDAPTHAGGQYFLHWIASNIPGEDLLKGDLSQATDITKYRGPGPPKGTGTHRYIFLLFQQEEKQQTITGSEQRAKFELLPWLRGQTQQLCGPVAGIQFLAQF